MKGTITIEFRLAQRMAELREESKKIAYSDLPLEERVAQLKELQASCSGNLGDIPWLYILLIEEDAAKSNKGKK